MVAVLGRGHARGVPLARRGVCAGPEVQHGRGGHTGEGRGGAGPAAFAVARPVARAVHEPRALAQGGLAFLLAAPLATQPLAPLPKAWPLALQIPPKALLVPVSAPSPSSMASLFCCSPLCTGLVGALILHSILRI